MKVLHAWLSDYLKDNTPSATEVERVLTFGAFEIDGIERVGEHDVIDVKVLPNRSSDCLCHRGIAHEIGSLTGTPLAVDPLTTSSPILPSTNRLSVDITKATGCSRFAVALVSGITVGPSPAWLKERLEALGQRSINNVVDATNYIMLALGQPLHAYDAAKFARDAEDRWCFGVRPAHSGESIEVLGGTRYELDPSIQLVINTATDAGAGIAGIKGGAYAVVDSNTTQIIVEAATFDPAITRKASQRLRLQTDASKRFENNVPAALVPYALNEVVKLIEELAGGTGEGVMDVEQGIPHNEAVRLHLKRAESILGISLEDEHIVRICTLLGCTVTQVETGVFAVTAPFWRTDITIEEDLIEEIGRSIGYDQVEAVVPSPLPLQEMNARHYYSEQVRDVLTSLGFSEVITSSFRKKDQLQLLNALAADKSCLRSTLTPNLTEAMQRNVPYADLLGLREVRMFEIGTVFAAASGGVAEHVSLALGVRTKAGGYVPKDDQLLEEALKALGETLGIPLAVEAKQGVAEINLTALITSLPAPTAYMEPKVATATSYRSFSNFPPLARDIALWVDGDVSANDVADLLDAHAGPLRARTTLFDTFSKDGRTSYAFRLVFQATDRTLTDEEITGEMERVYEAVRGQGWEVR